MGKNSVADGSILFLVITNPENLVIDSSLRSRWDALLMLSQQEHSETANSANAAVDEGA